MKLSNLEFTMKTTFVCTILASILTCFPVVYAEDSGAGENRKHSSDSAPRVAEMWKKVDLDSDGAISRDEFSQMPRLDKLPEDKQQILFDRLDKNSDGRIDRTEMHPGKPRQGQARPNMPQIWDLDINRDGGVSFEEFQAGRFIQRIKPDKQERMFRHLDSNGDGIISREDRPKMRPRPEGDESQRPQGGVRPIPGGGQRKHPNLIQDLDKDGDDELSLEEFLANPRTSQLDESILRKRFAIMDRNGDGLLNRADIQRRDGLRPPSNSEAKPTEEATFE